MNDKTIDSYLFNEMSEQERERFEERFLEDDELFYQIADRENELVDRYAKGELVGDELSRFEAGLAENPARRQKIANSRVLREFMADERAENKAITIAERSGLFSKIASLFSFGSPAFQFASLGAIVLLGIASVLLLIENRKLNSLESELAALQQRESELTAQIESVQDTSSELTNDLAAERDRVRDLEAEITRLIQTGSNVSPPENNVKPTIATLLLVPAGIRGQPRPVQRVELPSDVDRAAVVITLGSEVSPIDRVEVRLNDELVSRSARVRTNRAGDRTVTVTIPVSRISDGRNEITLADESGKVLERYLFRVEGRK